MATAHHGRYGASMAKATSTGSAPERGSAVELCHPSRIRVEARVPHNGPRPLPPRSAGCEHRERVDEIIAAFPADLLLRDARKARRLALSGEAVRRHRLGAP